jgi:hypothetical protein
MATKETSFQGAPEMPAEQLEPVETVRFPDGTIEPSHPLVLKGLEASIASGRIQVKDAVKIYQRWDPEYPEANIHRYFNSNS